MNRTASVSRATRPVGLSAVAMFFLLVGAHLVAANDTALRVTDASAQFVLGWDSNPIASGGAAAQLLGEEESLVAVASARINLSAGADPTAFKLSYVGERTHFDRLTDEDFSTHRVALSSRRVLGSWTTTLDASTLYIDGSREGLPSTAAANGNAVALWRDRRDQSQYRAKFQAQTASRTHLMRATATWLDYDYRTLVSATCVPFADRSDAQLGADFGWKGSSRSTWLAGVRLGQQRQATVALPNSAFAYGNRYHRVALGWEGALSDSTTAAFIAGPDWRHYSGAIDPRVFSDRNRVNLWFEGNLSAKPRSGLVLTARAARFEWLSSTGKSAYRDSSVEVAAAWTVQPRWTIRGSAKVHQCDYYPAVRDDWESLLGVGFTHQLSPALTVTADFTHHLGWNALPRGSEREFTRTLAMVGLTWKH